MRINADYPLGWMGRSEGGKQTCLASATGLPGVHR
jgi:hypothetical protein